MSLEGMCIDTYMGTINGIDIMFFIVGVIVGHIMKGKK